MCTLCTHRGTLQGFLAAEDLVAEGYSVEPYSWHTTFVSRAPNSSSPMQPGQQIHVVFGCFD
jgi:hypothetical protein